MKMFAKKAVQFHMQSISSLEYCVFFVVHIKQSTIDSLKSSLSDAGEIRFHIVECYSLIKE